MCGDRQGTEHSLERLEPRSVAHAKGGCSGAPSPMRCTKYAAPQRGPLGTRRRGHLAREDTVVPATPLGMPVMTALPEAERACMNARATLLEHITV